LRELINQRRDKRHCDTPRSAKAMPNNPPEKPRLPDNFAAFDIDPRRSGRRKPTWRLRPTHAPSEGATADAARFITKANLYEGLGRKPVKE
jgi:hypothetical protein